MARTSQARQRGVLHGLLIGAIILFSVTVMMFATPEAGAAFKYLQKGSEIPAFNLKSPDGAQVGSELLKEGKVGVLLFWATWSQRSVDEMRELEALYQKHKDKGLHVIAINVNHLTYSSEDLSAIREAARSAGVTYPVLLDNGLETYNAFGVVATPSTAVIDQSGQILFEISSFASFTMEEIQKSVEIGLGIRQPEAEVVGKAETGYKPERKALLYYNLGRNLLKMSSRDKAIDKLQQAAEADPKYAAPRVLLGHLLLEEGGKKPERLADARKLFEEALQAEPKNVPALAGLGDALLQQGQVGEAEGRYREAVALDGTFTPAVAGLASCLAANGKHEEALERFKAALELNPLSPDVYVRRAAAYEGKGMLRESARDLRRAVELLLGLGLQGNEV